MTWVPDPSDDSPPAWTYQRLLKAGWVVGEWKRLGKWGWFGFAEKTFPEVVRGGWVTKHKIVIYRAVTVAITPDGVDVETLEQDEANSYSLRCPPPEAPEKFDEFTGPMPE